MCGVLPHESVVTQAFRVGWHADCLWSAIRGAIDSSSPGAAENAAVAAAALAGVLPPGSHGLVTDVVQKLRAGMGSRSAPASCHMGICYDLLVICLS